MFHMSPHSYSTVPAEVGFCLVAWVTVPCLGAGHNPELAFYSTVLYSTVFQCTILHCFVQQSLNSCVISCPKLTFCLGKSV